MTVLGLRELLWSLKKSYGAARLPASTFSTSSSGAGAVLEIGR
jgi:hypothetical protein